MYLLFKIDCSDKDITEIEKLLLHYSLSSFQFRFFFKLATFAFKMRYGKNSPPELKNDLTESSKIHAYDLRSTTKLFLEPIRF